ncbi:hypothetical protein TeGR_g3729 [Tetraparma gracilis]|uniref:Fe2OG dioxygenase domain-containing protein n=1 Tax=Tetraparma gracilis TaxID=2962635 RepID=A0ABQ6MGY5_9STRA|nr:hypothetical protein TeGR_g3729 [Tetraparma gracilis]
MPASFIPQLLFATAMCLFVLPQLVVIPASYSTPADPAPVPASYSTPYATPAAASPAPIPVVSFHDLSPHDLSPPSLAPLAASLSAAFSSHGFAILSNVSLPAAPELLAAAEGFFGEPLEAKMRHSHGPYGTPEGGYTPQGTESVSATLASSAPHARRTGADRVENFVFRSMHSDDRDERLHPPELYTAGKRYFDEASGVLRLLNRLACEALGCPDAEYFNRRFWDGKGSNFDATPQNGNSLRLSHYPPAAPPTCAADGCGGEAERIRYGAHTDYQTFTLLLQDPRDHRGGFGGLEVLVGADWVPVLPPEGNNPGTVSLIVNCGDLTEVWSNGLWKSNLHRVTNPTSEEGWAQGRISVPFFTGPKDDTLVEPLAAAVERAGGRRFESVGAKEHLMRKLGLSNE